MLSAEIFWRIIVYEYTCSVLTENRPPFPRRTSHWWPIQLSRESQYRKQWKAVDFTELWLAGMYCTGDSGAGTADDTSLREADTAVEATREEQQVLQAGDSSFFAVFSFSFKLVNLFVVCCKKQTEKSGKYRNIHIDTLFLSCCQQRCEWLPGTGIFFFQQLGPDVTVEWVVRLHIPVVSVSNLKEDTSYSKDFSGFPVSPRRW